MPFPSREVLLGVTLVVFFDIAFLLYIRGSSAEDVAASKRKFAEELQNEKDMREKERLGRISVQKRIRERLTQENFKLGYQYRPIAFVESPFPDRRGTPRQPVLVPSAMGKIRFDKTIIQHEHFKEIIQFSHIWVMFVFHENTNGDTEASQVPAKIKPPRLGGQKVGCLTTRSPHRPNPIGLSVCEVVEVGSDYIQVSGIDMVDGTPVLDIKPYIPYDSIQLQGEEGADSSFVPLPMSATASHSFCLGTDGTVYKPSKLRVPQWIIDSDIIMRPVTFNQCALDSLEDLALDRVLLHCSSALQARDLITQVLRQDIRGVHQGRGKISKVSSNVEITVVDDSTSSVEKVSGSDLEAIERKEQQLPVEYVCRLDCMLLKFITDVSEIRVKSIEHYRGPPISQEQ